MSGQNDLSAFLYLNQEMNSAELHTLDLGDVVVFSKRQPDAENDRLNQDSALVISIRNQSIILAVADGCGGHRAGDQASRLALEKLLAAVNAGISNNRELRESILNGFEQANAAVIGLGVGALTTLSVVEIDQTSTRAYHVGDSSIIIASQRGTVKFQSLAHSPVGYALEAGIISESEALSHNERHIVSNVVGCADMRIDIGSSLPLAARDIVLIGSDGLFDNFKQDEIVEEVRTGGLIESIDTLANNCLRRMSQIEHTPPPHIDDMTMVAFRLR